MRVFRIIVVIVFAACLGLYAGTGIREKLQNQSEEPKLYAGQEILELSTEDPPEKMLEGLTASDAEDGDLTDSILISGTSHFVGKGELHVTYVVFDSDNHSASLTRKVRYTDYRPPEFALTQPLIFQKNASADLLEYVQAADVLDGDITERVKVAEDSLDTTSPGVYPVTFEVTNSCGDRAAVTVNAVVRDADPAGSITLTDSLIYLDRGGEFQPGDYVSAVTTSSGQTLQTEGLQIYEDGYFLTNISANGTVNTAEPGCYQVEYTYRTSRSEGSAWLTVMVRE